MGEKIAANYFFNNNKNLETKIEVVQHLLKNAQQSLDLIKVNDVFDTGKCKAEYDRYVKSFGSKEKYASEIHFTKNKRFLFIQYI